MAEERPVRQGPGPRGPRGAVSLKDVGRVWPTLKRLLIYTFSRHKFAAAMVLVTILAGAFAQIRGTLFMQTLIDDYILPMIGAQNPDFGPLAAALIQLAVIFAIGIVCSWAHSRIMINITQETLLRMRDEVFEKMESLPIAYFDTHAHGDIMSVYTNDIDTLRQMINQTLPQMVNSMITIVMAFVSMIMLNIPLTVLVLFMVGFMLFFAGKLGGLSGKYFRQQQNDLGKVDGYIEEMMAGQKVVKVFCHEDQSVEQFTELNESLRDSAEKANVFSSMLMPLNMNIGNISYVLCAIVGGAFAGLFGVLIGIPVLRLRGDYLAIVTLAFGEIIRNVLNCLYFSLDGNRLHVSFNNPNIPGTILLNGPNGAKDVGKIATFPVGFVLILFTLFVVLNLINSRSGRAIMATRDNRIAAEAMGINVTKYKMMAFVTAAVLVLVLLWWLLRNLTGL